MSLANKQFSVIQIRRGNESEFVSSNIILASGEPAYAVDSKTFKIGDGTTPWNNLPGLAASGSLLQFSPTSSSGLASLITDETGSGLVVFNTSPSFSGAPTAPTAPSGTNTNQIATTSFVRTEVSNLVDSAPQLLDTLNELAAAINDDANFYNTISNNIITVSGLLPTITNSGDNRILTSDGSTRGINAKNNLTFDGSLLNVNGSGVFSSGLYVNNIPVVVGSGSSYKAASWSSDGSQLLTSPLTIDPSVGMKYETYSGSIDLKVAEIDDEIGLFTRNKINNTDEIIATYRQYYNTYEYGGQLGVATIVISSGRDVGIHNNNPAYTLEVNGSGNFASGLYVNGTQILPTPYTSDNSSNIVPIFGSNNIYADGGITNNNTICGGTNNTMQHGVNSFIGAGYNNNLLNADNSIILGGYNNQLGEVAGSTSLCCSILGGRNNIITHSVNHSVIYGGSGNSIGHGSNCSIVGYLNTTYFHDNTHIIGSGITADSGNSTYVNNITIVDGLIRVNNIPTSDPGITGVVWCHSGTLKVSGF